MSTVRIDPLSKENYESWKLQAEAILIKNDLWKYTNGKIPKPVETATDDLDKWEAQDAKAKADLILCISSTELRHVRDCKTSREIWLRLESIYASRGPARKAMLLKRLLTHKMGDSGDIREDIGAFFDAVDKLESMDIKIHDDLLSIMLLYTLPASFSNFRCAIECRDDLPQPEILKVKILEEYESRNVNNTENDVLYVRERKKAANKWRADVNFKGTPAQTQPNRFSHKEDNYANERRVLTCFRCNRLGHKASECRENYPKSNQHCNNVDDGLMSLNVSGLEECSIVDNLKQQWVLDSGCTSHLCNDVNLFGGTLEEYKGKLRLATNMNAEVLGRGLVTLSVANGLARPVEFKDTLYVPDLRTNLISVAKITDNGYDVNFTRDVAVLVDKNGKARLTAHRIGNLYCFPECDSVNAVINCKTDLKLWHERLGHLNAKDVIKLLGKIGLDVNSSEISVSTLRSCDICARGKMTMLPFTESSGPCNERLRIVYSDIVGPMRCESKSGAKYFITFIDDSTRWCDVYFLKTKDKALEAFKLYKNYVEKYTGTKIKYFQSDNGGEYVNAEFDEFLRKEGIQRRLTVPRTPQQNGVAEKMNRTLVEMARCMLLNSDLCISFWAEAIDTACYVRNRCPTSALDGDIPYEKWCQKQVNIYYLRRFGERVYVLDKDPNLGKFDARGIAGVFVGYSKTTKGFRVWIPEKRKFIVSRDIKFTELISADSATKSLDEAKDFIEMISSRGDVQTTVDNSNKRQDQASVEMVFTKEINERAELPIVTENVERRHALELNPDHGPETVEGTHDLERNLDQGPDNVEEIHDLELNPDKECEVVLKRGSGRPKVIRTGRPGRPKKVYNYVEVEERNSESEAEEYRDCDDYAGAALEISLNDALRSSERSEWEDAILSEIRSLVQKGTWNIVKTPPNTNVVGCRYVLTTKINVDKTTKKKARLVAQGFSQRFGVDYEKTFAPVARLETVRLMMAIAVEMDLEIHQVDINTAYLNGNLDEQIYMRIPRLLKECLLKLAYDNDEDPVIVKNAKKMLEDLKAGGDTCLLKKSLYGLKQAGRQWNIRFDKKLKDMGLEQSLNEPCLYMRHQDGKHLFVLVFVDDVLIASDCEGRICRFKDELKKEFDLKDYGKVKYFLGIDIKKNDENGITLSQESYVKSILEKFGLSNCNSCKTPSELCDIFWSETKRDEVEEKWPYRELIGSLMYLSVATRPDITNTVVKLAQFVSNPNLSHWKAAKRVLRYLKGTASYGLNYKKTGKPIQAYCDANWGSCPIDRKSYSGYCCILGGASISWSSRKQKTVATSSCEAEYVSLAEAFKECLYLQSLLTEMKLPGYAIISIYTDSQSAMFLAQDPVFHGRSKHIDIKYHFIRGALKDNNNIMLGHVPTESMLADVLTKALPSIKHNRCLNGLGLKPC